MKTSQNGIDLIKKWESCQLKAYKCPAGVWTIGYGHTKGVKAGDVCTKIQAEIWLKEEVFAFEVYINLRYKNLNQNQFDALVSLCYNIGPGNLRKSPIHLAVKNNPNDPDIRLYFMKHVYAAGKKLNGLINRRMDEVTLYFKPVNYENLPRI